MFTTQYKITLPSNYDMNIIKDRVSNNGHLTDGFEDLKFKLYLTTEKGTNNNIQNSYCPLYLWKGNNGLNHFLFNGFYDNILNSFGWQQVHVGIPLLDITTSKIVENKYLFEISGEIPPQTSLKNLRDSIEASIPTIMSTEYIITYNPEKWNYHMYYFLNDLDKVKELSGITYHILHISQGK